jgi:hypothetical protein
LPPLSIFALFPLASTKSVFARLLHSYTTVSAADCYLIMHGAL